MASLVCLTFSTDIYQRYLWKQRLRTRFWKKPGEIGDTSDQVGGVASMWAWATVVLLTWSSHRPHWMAEPEYYYRSDTKGHRQNGKQPRINGHKGENDIRSNFRFNNSTKTSDSVNMYTYIGLLITIISTLKSHMLHRGGENNMDTFTCTCMWFF